MGAQGAAQKHCERETLLLGRTARVTPTNTPPRASTSRNTSNSCAQHAERSVLCMIHPERRTSRSKDACLGRRRPKLIGQAQSRACLTADDSPLARRPGSSAAAYAGSLLGELHFLCSPWWIGAERAGVKRTEAQYQVRALISRLSSFLARARFPDSAPTTTKNNC